MNPIVEVFLQNIHRYASPFVELTGEDNEERARQLLDAVLGWEESPYEEHEEPPYAFERAQREAAQARAELFPEQQD